MVGHQALAVPAEQGEDESWLPRGSQQHFGKEMKRDLLLHIMRRCRPEIASRIMTPRSRLYSDRKTRMSHAYMVAFLDDLLKTDE